MTEILELSAEVQRDIFGSKDHYVRKIEKDLEVAVIARDGVIKVTGDEPNGCQKSGRHSREPGRPLQGRRGDRGPERGLRH